MKPNHIKLLLLLAILSALWHIIGMQLPQRVINAVSVLVWASLGLVVVVMWDNQESE